MRFKPSYILLVCGIFCHQTRFTESGKAIQIISPHNHSFKLNSNSVAEILSNEHLKDRYIMVFSIAGPLRKGKSFYLNFCLKYLDARYKRHDVFNWIGSGEHAGELNGFNWRGGQKPETTGIWMWSEIFTHDFENGEKVAIILLDTQGLFDHESSTKYNIATFAVSVMLSSVQVYNVMQNIQENDLENLSYFTEYGRLAMEQTREKPFQNLLFLVRDWPNAHELNYGYAPEYIEQKLTINNKQTPDMQQLREQIKSSFQKMNAFLMPHPGSAVAQGQNSNGDLKEIDQKFIDYIKVVVPSIFAPENLVIKKINGQNVRSQDFITYLKAYVEVFNGNTLPEPKTALMATAEVSISTLSDECLKSYVNSMNKLFKYDRSSYSPSDLLGYHETARKGSLLKFENSRKLGGYELISRFQQKLEINIAEKFKTFEQMNRERQKSFDEINKLKSKNEIYESQIEQLLGISKKENKGFLSTMKGVATTAVPCALLGFFTLNPLAIGGCFAGLETARQTLF